MSLTIFVRKKTSSSRYPRFVPHFNSELGKKYYEAHQYYSDVKKAGLEPYDPGSIKKPERKPYKMSSWARGMHGDISIRKGRKPSDRFISELDKRGFNQKRYDEAKKLANEPS